MRSVAEAAPGTTPIKAITPQKRPVETRQRSYPLITFAFSTRSPSQLDGALSCTGPFAPLARHMSSLFYASLPLRCRDRAGVFARRIQSVRNRERVELQ